MFVVICTILPLDKDECLVSGGGCSHGCQNNEGSFLCTCPAGLELGQDARTCIGMWPQFVLSQLLEVFVPEREREEGI